MQNGFEKIILPNGLRLVLSHLPAFRSVTVIVLCGAGSRYEKAQTNGVSHFIEHMFFKGTKKRPTASDISHALDEIGADYNAFTGKETTGYYIKSASQHLPLLVDMLSDMLWNSDFLEAEIEKERGVIIEEINLYEDMPPRRVGEIYEQLLWENQPLGWDIGGSKDVIRSLQREDFISYIDERYVPNNLVVSVAGDFKRDDLVSYITKCFGKQKGHDVPGFLPAVDDQKKPQVKSVYKKTDQAHIIVGVRGFKLSHPDRYNAAVLATILGGGMSSRLFLNVREKRGLAYYVSAAHESYLDTGTLSAAAGVDIKRVDDAVKVILEEFSKIGQEKVLERELRKAKEYLKGKVILMWEDSRNVAAGYGTDELLERKVRTMDEFLKSIDAVSAEDVQRVAQFLFDESKLNLAAIGPFKDGLRLQKLLKF